MEITANYIMYKNGTLINSAEVPIDLLLILAPIRHTGVYDRLYIEFNGSTHNFNPCSYDHTIDSDITLAEHNNLIQPQMYIH
jgi:hypothetical protein